MLLLSRSRALLLALTCPGVWLACSADSQPSGVAAGGTQQVIAGGGNSAAAAGVAGHASGLAGSAASGSYGAGGSAGSSTAGQPAAGSNSGGQPSGGTSTGGQSVGGASNAGQSSGGASAGHAGMGAAGAAGAPSKPLDVTFYVVSDTHADPPPSNDLQPMARAINAVAKGGAWPAKIDGQDTHFKAGSIGKPRGVVFDGDLTGWGTAPTELTTFRHYFEAGNSADSISFPAYLGLGNHDLDSADRPEPLASQYRALEWGYVDARHKGPNAPTPVTNYDAGSHDYSFDFDGIHLIQLHRHANDREFGLPSAQAFLAADLKKYASDGRPVFLFQHYGMDPFGTQARWWTDADRVAYRATLKGYHVSAAIVGHTHAAFNYGWEGLRVFQVNNAKAENGTGNNDGNGSFAIVHVTAEQLDVVTCRWLDDQGKYELVSPYFSGPLDPGGAP